MRALGDVCGGRLVAALWLAAVLDAAMPVSAKCDLGRLTAREACLRDHAGTELIMNTVRSHAK